MLSREKREFVRVPFTTEAEIRTGNQLFRSSSGMNISLNGLRIATNEPLPGEGSPCSAKIILKAFDHHIAIEAKGRIARTGQGYLAVEFTEIDPDSYLHLRHLIINNAEDPVHAEEEFDAHWGIRRPHQ